MKNQKRITDHPSDAPVRRILRINFPVREIVGLRVTLIALFALITLAAGNAGASSVKSLDFNTESDWAQEDGAKTDIAGGAVTLLCSAAISATGGTVTTVGGYEIHTFTSSGTFNVTGSGNVEALIVAGGGGGGCGGGGGGGLIYSSSSAVTTQSYSVVVGAGGAKGGYGATGSSGGNSSFLSYTAIGGGGGAGVNIVTGGSGGSGGGGGGCGGGVRSVGGSATSGQGNNGGENCAYTYPYPSGGGGGAGAVGGNAAIDGNSYKCGVGGDGLAYSISGSSVYYAGGGGGGMWEIKANAYAAGGIGGGGAGRGGGNTSATDGIAGTANTGGGGGGAGGNGDSPANGGSGIVIVRFGGEYPTSQSYYITTASGAQIDTSLWDTVDSVSIDETTPANTSTKYMVSFDGRNTWQYWTGSAWSNSSLNDLQTNGMSKTAVEAISGSQWASASGFVLGTLDFAIDLNTTDPASTPQLNGIDVNYSTQSYDYVYAGLDSLSLGYIESEKEDLYQLYKNGKAGLEPENITIDGTEWQYYDSEFLPGEDPENPYAIGTAYTYLGKQFIKLGSGIGEPLGGVPELPAGAVAFLGAVFGAVVARRRVRA